MSDIPTTIKNEALVKKRREQIVLAAIKLFSKKGFHQTTLRDLSAEADLSSGNIYDYVGSKNDIFCLVHEYLYDKVLGKLRHVVEMKGDPCEKLRRMISVEFNLINQWSEGTLLLYQEGHVLKGPSLKKFLEKEHEHVQMFEMVINECVQKGFMRDCNTRLSANLIKIMIDCWVVKRWDLRRHITGLEAERSILEMIFYGLLLETDCKSRSYWEIDSIGGKRALVVGGDTVLGDSVCSTLSLKGVKVCTYLNTNSTTEKGKQGLCPEPDLSIRQYYKKEHGPMCSELFRFIEDDFGPIDIYIQDIGIGSLVETGKLPEAAELLERNLHIAKDLARPLQDEMKKKTWGRIIYIAPWAWDRYLLDPICYNTIQAGTLALTETMAMFLAPYNINVNCIVPGFIKTAESSILQKAKEEKAAGQISTDHLSETSDVTNLVKFLLRDVSRHLTNQVLRMKNKFNNLEGG
ncbi:MAG: SDR family oxidoreductase [Deltaproteobacteria bacterium]|nr:SDR family oxidoreductase [Deltaproteobacteria bacterium]